MFMEYTILEQVKIRLGQYIVQNATSEEESENNEMQSDTSSENTNSTIVFTENENNLIIEMLIEENKDFLLMRMNRNKDCFQEGEFESKYRSPLIECVLFDYVMRGGEFQESHVENGITRKWVSKDEIVNRFNIVPFVRFLL